MRSALLLGLVWVACPTAIAGEATGDSISVEGLRRCAQVAAAEARLACFDDLARHFASPAANSKRAKEAFGLSAAQRAPVGEPLNDIEAKVTGFGRSGANRPTIRLDNGQIWELDGDDPLLDEQQTVTIRRAAMSSFLLTTQHKRTHRVRRLK